MTIEKLERANELKFCIEVKQFQIEQLKMGKAIIKICCPKDANNIRDPFETEIELLPSVPSVYDKTKSIMQLAKIEAAGRTLVNKLVSIMEAEHRELIEEFKKL